MESNETYRSRFKVRWFVAILAVSACLFLTTDPTIARKWIMAMMAPAALIGLMMCLTLTLAAMRCRKLALQLFMVMGLVYAVCSNDVFADWLLASLERDYYHIDPFTIEPVDVLVVLGGGLSTRRNGVSLVNRSGDRVMLAARLYKQGKAKRLVTTGGPIPQIGLPFSTSTATARVWRDLGIPESDILIQGGTSTLEEFKQLKNTLRGEERVGRIGLLTSAWHLPRAIRQAERNNLAVVPVPTDFRTDFPPEPLLFRLIPSADALDGTHRALLEYVGMAMGR